MHPSTPPVRTRIDCTLDYQLDGPSDFVFLIHACAGWGQSIVEEQLTITPPLPFRTYTDLAYGNRFLRLQAQAGPLRVGYWAVVDRVPDLPDTLAAEAAIDEIPDDVLRFLMPTRYCESDLLSAEAQRLFGGLPRGHARVLAVSEWVRLNIEYRIGSTTATSTAGDVYQQRSGVCRDFAHLAITFCRALNIPARLVCGYAAFPEPPPDFHAIFEAWLGGRWVLFDPTGMVPVDRVVRVATGRDAKDVAFATIFGPARMVAMSPDVAPAFGATFAPVAALAATV